MARRGRGQFEFTVVELAVLGASFAVTSGLVFLLGFYVGREVASEHAPLGERVARIPVAPAPPKSAGPSVPPAIPPAIPMDPTAPKEAEAEASPEAAPQPPEPGPAERAAAAPQTGAADRPGAGQEGPPPGEQAALAPSAPPTASPAEPPSPEPAGSEVERRDLLPAVGYTVQVLATRNRKEAESLAAELKGNGFGAFVTAVEDAGGRWYRVRIGRYDDPHAARVMVERCKRDLGLSQAYVSPFRMNSR